MAEKVCYRGVGCSGGAMVSHASPPSLPNVPSNTTAVTVSGCFSDSCPNAACEGDTLYLMVRPISHCRYLCSCILTDMAFIESVTIYIIDTWSMNMS